jgi:hypothetical protein
VNGLTDVQRINRVAAEIRLFCPWMPPHQAAMWAHLFVRFTGAGA